MTGPELNTDSNVRVTVNSNQGQGARTTSSGGASKNVKMVSDQALAQDQTVGLTVEITGNRAAGKAGKAGRGGRRTVTNHTIKNDNRVASNSGNSIGSVGGNAVIGNGNTVGGDNSINISGNNNNVGINANPQPAKTQPNPKPQPKPQPKPKPTVSKKDKAVGENLARQLHAETNSSWANNGKIAATFAKVNDKNAYTFFKEYRNLAKADNNVTTTGAMHDTYDVSDVLNNINMETTTPALQALLNQAESIGLGNSQEYASLKTLMSLSQEENNRSIKAKLGITPDLNDAQANGIDAAVSRLVDKMGKVYQ